MANSPAASRAALRDNPRACPAEQVATAAAAWNASVVAWYSHGAPPANASSDSDTAISGR